jgi:hypothetical protein
MRSPISACESASHPTINFQMPESIFMKLCALTHLSGVLNKFFKSVRVSICVSHYRY